MLEESTARTADSDHQPGTCRHCGAPLVRVVTSYRHNIVGDVCSVGWFADYAPFARPCGAPTTEDQDPRYSLTAKGLALVQARPA